QAMTIQHGMDGAFGWDGYARKSAQQALANLAGTPTRVFTLHIQNEVLHLERKLVGVVKRTPASVGESLNAAFLIAIEDLVARLGGNTEPPADFRHRFAG